MFNSLNPQAAYHKQNKSNETNQTYITEGSASSHIDRSVETQSFSKVNKAVEGD